MAKILLIETSTALCSVALAADGKVMSSRKSALDRSHASMTAVFCDEVLREAGMKAADLDAVCISDGPGSYTGLRVGLSTAKGLCFGADIKLLSISSLDVLADMAVEVVRGVRVSETFALHLSGGREGVYRKSCGLSARTGGLQPVGGQSLGSPHTPNDITDIIPMIDARRMEVYTANYNALGERVSEIEARVVEEGAYAQMPESTIFIGDGALKCKEAIGKGIFIEAYPEASAMATRAEKEYAAGNFRDVAYFEPFYLKEFVATVSKKKLF